MVSVYDDSGVTASQRGGPDSIEGAVLVLADSTELVFGVLARRVPYGGTDSTVSIAAAIRRGRGTQRVMSVLRRSPEATEGIESYREAVDIDRDGWPEIITQVEYYESYSYILYGFRHRTFGQLYAGGGGGC
jgi:hypothetical protein